VLGRFDVDFVVAAIEGVIRRVVRDGVLIAQFLADVLKRLIEIVHVIRKEGAAAGLLGQALQGSGRHRSDGICGCRIVPCWDRRA